MCSFIKIFLTLKVDNYSQTSIEIIYKMALTISHHLYSTATNKAKVSSVLLWHLGFFDVNFTDIPSKLIKNQYFVVFFRCQQILPASLVLGKYPYPHRNPLLFFLYAYHQLSKLLTLHQQQNRQVPPPQSQ